MMRRYLKVTKMLLKCDWNATVTWLKCDWKVTIIQSTFFLLNAICSFCGSFQLSNHAQDERSSPIWRRVLCELRTVTWDEGSFLPANLLTHQDRLWQSILRSLGKRVCLKFYGRNNKLSFCLLYMYIVALSVKQIKQFVSMYIPQKKFTYTKARKSNFKRKVLCPILTS